MKKRFTRKLIGAALSISIVLNPLNLKADETASKTFIDYFLPTPITGSLKSDAWGAAQVGPRDQSNGLEDTKLANWDYWDGHIIKGPDGKYHFFGSRWDQAKGHDGWYYSKAIHAVSDNLYGPYVDQGLCWPDNEDGKGHNVTALELPDGRFAIVVSETRPGDVFVSNSLNGPWTLLGSLKIANNEFTGLAWTSNVSIMVRPDGQFEIISRSGAIWISKDGVLGPYTIQGPSIYPKVVGLDLKNLEDPVIWYSGGLYHILVNSWSDRKAFHITSADGINDWKYRGLAYDPTRDFVRYTDGTVNHWNKLERPSVYLENGHVVAVTLAVIDVPKDQETGSDGHGSKIIVIPFDGAAMDRDLPDQSVPEAYNLANVLSPTDTIQPIKMTTKGTSNVLAQPGDFGGSGNDELATNAIDGDSNTKYYNHAVDGSNAPGVNTGLVVIPKAGSTLVTQIQFTAGNDLPERDPLEVTLEGSNSKDAAQVGCKDWELIYEGPSGLSLDPGRCGTGALVSLKNTKSFTAYRLLVTKVRNSSNATQYSEIALLGKISSN